ncbi:hypothetical protein RvY_19295-2 [Ramazzottius varieornatus]|nr:hypothetical protein RvY_19295-2 [Ramazzottius varieornatus]
MTGPKIGPQVIVAQSAGRGSYFMSLSCDCAELSREYRTFFFDKCFHVGLDLVAPPSNGHMQPIIATNFFVRPFPPLLVSSQMRVAFLRDSKVDCKRLNTVLRDKITR